MSTVTKTWDFAASAQSWSFTASGTGNAGAWASSGGDVSGCVNNVMTGKNGIGAGHWDITGTWESLFGVPAGAVVTQSGGVAGDGHWWKCSVYTTGAASTEGPLELRSGASLLGTFTTTQAYSATSTGARPAASAISVAAGQQASNTSITIRLNGAVKTGNSSTANNTLLQDTVVLTATYSFPTLNLSLSATEAQDTASVTSKVTVKGSLSATDVPDAASVTSKVKVRSSLSGTDVLDTGSLTDKVKVSSTVSGSDSVDTASFSTAVSNPAIHVSMSATEAIDTGSFSEKVVSKIGLSTTDAVDTSAVTSKVKVQASVSGTDPVDTGTFTSKTRTQAQFSATEATDTATGSVVVFDGMALSATDAIDQLAASVQVALGASLVATEPNDSAAFSLTQQQINRFILSGADIGDTGAFGFSVITPFTPPPPELPGEPGVPSLPIGLLFSGTDLVDSGEVDMRVAAWVMPWILCKCQKPVIRIVHYYRAAWAAIFSRVI